MSIVNKESDDQNMVQALYKKLLRLYPRVFRDRMGESMAQTFDDLYKERKQGTKSDLPALCYGHFSKPAQGF